MSTLNLAGLRVLNTRPPEQSVELEQAIHAAGGLSIQCPAIIIQPANTHWLATLPELATVSKAIFISTNAVQYFFSALKEKAIDWPHTIVNLAIGQATKNALDQQGVGKILMPEQSDSDHLIRLAEMQHIHGEKILLIKGQGGLETLADYIKQHGGKLTAIDVYCRKLPDINPAIIESIWRNDTIDIILYTSRQAMRHVFELFGNQAKSWLQRKPCLVISQRLATAAEKSGIHSIHVTRPEAIVEALHQFRQGNHYD